MGGTKIFLGFQFFFLEGRGGREFFGIMNVIFKGKI